MRQPVVLHQECIQVTGAVRAVANWFGRADTLHTQYFPYKDGTRVERLCGLLELWQDNVDPWAEARGR